MKDRRSITSAENGKKGGRPRGVASIESEKARILICEKLSKHFGPIVDKAIEQAKEGNKDAREWLTERAYGKVKQDIGIGDVDDILDEDKKDKAKYIIGAIIGSLGNPQQ